MKEKLMKWLACPKCKDRLQLEVSQQEKNEIKVGIRKTTIWLSETKTFLSHSYFKNSIK